jgi:hypothetical protein
MLHSQLNIILPDRPYICHKNNICQKINFNKKILMREELMAYFQDLSTKIQDPTKTQDGDLVDYLDRLSSDPMNTYTTKYYTLLSQQYSTANTNTNLFINFHTTVYADNNGTLIDREFDSSVEWFVIPLIGKVNQNPCNPISNTRDKNISDKTISDKNIPDKTISDKTIPDKLIIIDNKHSLKKDIDMMNRIRKRHHPSGLQILPNTKKQDIIKKINIEMLPDTRNPFEYIKESVGINKSQILFNFSHINTGRINITFEKKINPIYFISVMRHKIKTNEDNEKYILYMTLHELIT